MVENSKPKEITARDFTQEEVVEVNQYITTDIATSDLPQLTVITEVLVKKAKTFATIYRLVNGGKNVVNGSATIQKLADLLAETQAVYTEL